MVKQPKKRELSAKDRAFIDSLNSKKHNRKSKPKTKPKTKNNKRELPPEYLEFINSLKANTKLRDKPAAQVLDNTLDSEW